MKLASPFISHTKINPKWVKYLNIRSDNIKLLEENIGKNLSDTGLGNDFLSMTLKVEAAKAKIDK